jgi:hypothetical protein
MNIAVFRFDLSNDEASADQHAAPMGYLLEDVALLITGRYSR